jgi:hypothetical protein
VGGMQVGYGCGVEACGPDAAERSAGLKDEAERRIMCVAACAVNEVARRCLPCGSERLPNAREGSGESRGGA